MRALVPAPGLRPVNCGFGIRSTLKLRFCIDDAWPGCGAGAARTKETRAKRKRACN